MHRLSGLAPARYSSRLLDPARHLRLVEIVFMDVDPARVLARSSRWNWLERRASEEVHFDVARESMEREEPALALDAIKGRVPFHRLAHIGHVANDELIEAAPDIAFPARHGRDIGLDGDIAVGLCDLRVAACEECRLCRRWAALEIERNGCTDEVLQRGFLDLVTLSNVDGSPDIPLKA